MSVRVAVLGAGPAGVGAAHWLAKRGFDVEVLERGNAVGGNAGSFELAGIRVDYGSHRLHPATDPELLAHLRDLLGDDLLERPRHGRINLMGRWIHFPLRPLNLLVGLPPRFALGAALDTLRRPFARPQPEGDESFASVLQAGLGRTICQEFYFPYARKIWGLDPEAISAIQAHKRVGANSVMKLLRRLLPGGAGSGGAKTKGIFFYPRRGYGQISEAIADAARAAGARICLNERVTRVTRPAEGSTEFEIAVESDGGTRTLRADHVWSTIPATVLVQLLEPGAPEDVLHAAKSLELRAMLLVYLVLEQDQFTEYDAHYFPGADLPLTRLSEPKNYSALQEPRGRTVLCAELPCSRSDAIWSASSDELRDHVSEALARAGLPIKSRILEVAVRRLPAAYPIYRTGYETHFERVDEWIDEIDGILSFGRQGLFAHDNTHHTLAMARAAVECLADDGRFDRSLWGRHREVFDTHVVED